MKLSLVEVKFHMMKLIKIYPGFKSGEIPSVINPAMNSYQHYNKFNIYDKKSPVIFYDN